MIIAAVLLTVLGAGAQVDRLCPAFPCVVDGVRILQEHDPTPRCPKTKPRRFDGEGHNVDEAIAHAVHDVALAGGDTYKVSDTGSKFGKGTVRGYGFICEGR